MKQKMIALKPFRYGSRALVAGDPFDASRRDARLLEAVSRARRYVPEPEVKAEDKPMAKAGDAEIDVLRARAAELGVEVDNRWRDKRLAEEIAKAAKAQDVDEEIADGDAE